MTRILMIGLGGIGQRHLRNLLAILGDSAEFIAYRVRGLGQVVTPQLGADVTRNVEEEFQIESFTNLGEALQAKPDMAVICNPSSAHVESALACAHAGCDLFIEKPVASSLDGLVELGNVVRERSLVVMVGYQLRYHPCFLKMSEIIAGGSLGRLLGVRAVIGEYLPGFHPYEDYRTMYASRSDQGGGVVLSQIHEFDYLYALFGLPKRLFAIGGQWSHLEIDVEDVASVLMQAEYHGSPLPIQLHQDYLQKPANRHCEVIGEYGRVAADFRNLRVAHYSPDSAEPQVFDYSSFERNDLFVSEMRHFLDCVRDRSKPIVDLDDGIASLKAALAVKESILTGRLVEIDG